MQTFKAEQIGPRTPGIPAALTLEKATTAFSAWNSVHRAAPETFLTQSECDAMAIATLSEGQAIYFLGLLRSQEVPA